MIILEYLAFGGSLVSSWLYGHQGIKGPIAGLITSILFIIFGYYANLDAAIISNIIFFFIHTRNLKTSINNNMNILKNKISKGMNLIVTECHQASKNSGWWDSEDINDKYLVPAKLSLIHSEISEALEGHRKNTMDDHLPHRKTIEVELADAIIRIADLAGALDLDLGGAIADKLEYNTTRPDHRPENRKGDNGKKY